MTFEQYGIDFIRKCFVTIKTQHKDFKKEHDKIFGQMFCPE